MALHRDIHWIGRQWAVTGFGMQVIDQKLAGRFDIEVARLWDEDFLEIVRAQKWFNEGDFAKALVIARSRFPAPPARPRPPPLPASAPVATLQQASDVTPPPRDAEPVKPQPVKVEPVAAPQPLPPEDLLGKWFDAYGLSQTTLAASSAAPQPPREVMAPSLPEQTLPGGPDEARALSAKVKPAPVVAQSAQEILQMRPAEAAKQEPSFLPIQATVKARLIKAWHVRLRKS
jgi:hypothetical protein